MSQKYAIIAVLLPLLASCSRNEPPSEVIYTPKIHPYHNVQRGETVQSVARKYKMNETDLIALNHLRAPYNLIEGQRLLVHPHPQALPETTEPMAGEPVDIVVTPLPQPEAAADQTATADGEEIVKTGEETQPDEATDTVKATASAAGYIRPVRGAVKIHPYDAKAKGVLVTLDKGNTDSTVLAIADGVVKHTGPIDGFGNCIVIKHANQNISIYCHLDKILVKSEKLVTQGANIGKMGMTGGMKQKSLLLQVYDANKKPVNPAKLLP